MSRLLLALALLSPLLTGCERARPYNPRPGRGVDTSSPTAERPKPLPPDVAWLEMGRDPFVGDVPIEFVHEGSRPDEWAKLPTFWNEPGLIDPRDKEKPRPAILLKVPLGLDDPTAYLSPANQPTRGKWELGRRLFFDVGWLTEKRDVACATCHVPNEGFTDLKARSLPGRNAPTLVNVVFNRAQFWDGRATYLEEVVQQTLEDERSPSSRHAWGGVIARLRKDRSYRQHFEKVYGSDVLPTQDGVGQAIATYLRTLLAGNSLHDRAVRVQRQKKAAKLEAAHYEAVLDDAALKQLGRPTAAKAVVAADLARGWKVFNGAGGCASCHPPGGHFSDSRFYNLGVGIDDEVTTDPEKMGRFAFAPLGEKNRYSIGAWKVPTLRSLLRTGPYFHDGSERDLTAVVRYHVRPRPPGAAINLHLDPKLAKPNGEHRDFAVDDDDIAAVVLLLRALNGDDVDGGLKIGPG